MSIGDSADVVIVGAGAAGLATAIFAARRLGPGRVVLLDSALRPGAKILVSGGGRCNVTNRVVTERDFAGVLRTSCAASCARSPPTTRSPSSSSSGWLFTKRSTGKLFPDTHKARTVLDALLGEAARRGVGLRAGSRVDRAPAGAAKASW